MKPPKRFQGLRLTTADRRELGRRRIAGKGLSARTWKRMEMLRLLDKGETISATADAVGMYRREVSRVAKRYLSGGLDHALSDEPRPGREAKLDSAQQA